MGSDLLREGFTYYRGRVGLAHVLKSLGIGASDQVAIQAYTCLAVPLAIKSVGAHPIYVDIELGTLSMSPGNLRERLHSGVNAIVLQSTFGIPAPSLDILEIAGEMGVPVIEDRCHCLPFDDHADGAVASFYSFEWGKPLVAGVGGGVSAHDPALRASMKEMGRAFSSPPLVKQIVLDLQYAAFRVLLRRSTYWLLQGLYKRLSSLGIVVGTFDPQSLDLRRSAEYDWKMAASTRRRLERELKRIDHIASRQREMTALYRAAFRDRDMAAFELPFDGLMRYPIVAEDKAGLMAEAKANRVELSGSFRSPIDPFEEEVLRRVHYEPGSCPAAERASQTIVSFPVADRVSTKQVNRYADFALAQRSRFGIKGLWSQNHVS